MRSSVCALRLLLMFVTLAAFGDTTYRVSAPAGQRPTSTDRVQGFAILPNGRVVKPFGKFVVTAPHPYGLALSPDGRMAVTANSGTGPFSLSVVRNLDVQTPDVTQIPPGANTDEGVLNAVFMGLAFLSDNRTLVVSGGDDGTVMLWDVVTGTRNATISCNVAVNGVPYADSYIGDLVLSHDGRTVYAVDQANFRLIVLDIVEQAVVASVPVGRYPFGVALSPDEKTVYVANVGMFEYQPVEGYDGTEGTALDFPPFAFGTQEAEEGVTLPDGRRVPGLGDPNAPESFSVWAVDTASRQVVAKVKTGALVGELVEGIPAVGGSSPNSIAVSDDYVFVSNGSNDSVTVISRRTNAVVTDIPFKLHPAINSLRGMIPFGVALSPDGTRLYVAMSGINAVAVVDTRLLAVRGYVPTAWFPSKLKVTPDGKQLVIANAKGFGSGPNGGANFTPGPEGRNIGRLMKGVVQICDVPDDAHLATLTDDVLRRNFLVEPASDDGTNPVPSESGGRQSPIRYVVYITKENRTFDQVYGDLPGVNGDPTLATLGAGRRVVNSTETRVVENVTVMPNHRRLAQQFTILDNFYCDSDHSADGHRWLVGVYPNEWVETSTSVSYGDRRRHITTSSAPGRRAVTGASGAIYPEDYNEAGAIWEHLERNGVHFWNFGLGFEFAGGFEEQHHEFTGIRIPLNYPMPKPLFERTSRTFATYNTNVPDQFRVDMFEKELNERWLSGKEPFPNLITMMLPNDHGSDERPADGYPFRESYMADNDLALGRVVAMLSQTPYWNEMVIFVTEDDAQGGLDHVDAHRSLCLVIGPWAKRGYVSKTHANFGSILKTMFHILGVPPLNQYDGGATLLSDCFTDAPDNTPYHVVGVHPEIFDPQKALDPYDANFDWSGIGDYPTLDHPEFFERELREEEERLRR
jgi:YVTN family beta-propeller protein